MDSEALHIPVEHPVLQHVSALLDHPPQDPGRAVVLLAHGAGAPMTSEFMGSVSAGLAARGLPVLRFNYAYSERMSREGRRLPPDRQPALEAVHCSALAALQERFPGRRVLLAGKSMGGRISSYLAAEGTPSAGLVYFGYPLHPPGKPERRRDEHFGAIAQPSLFLQGTRDALCDLELLRRSLETYGGVLRLHLAQGADHGFDLLKRSGRTREELWEELCEVTSTWEQETFPS